MVIWLSYRTKMTPHFSSTSCGIKLTHHLYAQSSHLWCKQAGTQPSDFTSSINDLAIKTCLNDCARKKNLDFQCASFIKRSEGGGCGEGVGAEKGVGCRERGGMRGTGAVAGRVRPYLH